MGKVEHYGIFVAREVLKHGIWLLSLLNLAINSIRCRQVFYVPWKWSASLESKQSERLYLIDIINTGQKYIYLTSVQAPSLWEINLKFKSSYEQLISTFLDSLRVRTQGYFIVQLEPCYNFIIHEVWHRAFIPGMARLACMLTLGYKATPVPSNSVRRKS